VKIAVRADGSGPKSKIRHSQVDWEAEEAQKLGKQTSLWLETKVVVVMRIFPKHLNTTP
jgi:hypothetical protein